MIEDMDGGAALVRQSTIICDDADLLKVYGLGGLRSAGAMRGPNHSTSEPRGGRLLSQAA